MRPIDGRWTAAILAEQLVPVPEPLVFALQPGPPGEAAAVASRAARALLDLPKVAPEPPSWLTPHQVPAFIRLCGLIDRYGGALLADAVGLGKSYVALAVALRMDQTVTLVVPAVLIPQWRRLLEEKEAGADIISHESLSTRSSGIAPGIAKTRLLIVDEAHRFRNPETLRYRRLAEMCIGARVLLVTATPVHNRIADVFHLFRLFLRDDALTALGVGSLVRGVREGADAAEVRAVASRLTVARSRARASGAFPERASSRVVRVGAAPDDVIATLVRGVADLKLGGHAAALLRIALLRRLASSLPAFRATVERYRAFTDLAAEAASLGRRLEPGDFQQLFPRDDGAEIQLSLLPLVLDAAPDVLCPDAAPELDRLRTMAFDQPDPKAEQLGWTLTAAQGKTIVFTEALETARYLTRRLGQRWRVAAVSGSAGWFGTSRASPQDVFAAFAPRAQGCSPPPRALETDVLIATDLASEGLNLQDAERVVHYDLPWSPARLAQRVGRVDRLGSPHQRIETIAFLPPPPLDDALRLERRIARKILAQRAAGAAARETLSGPDAEPAPLDWCDRLQELAAAGDAGWTQVRADFSAVVLVVRLGGLTEVFVIENEVSTSPERATCLLERSVLAEHVDPDRDKLESALRHAVPAIRARLQALEATRWRAEDRDRIGRRLIPWVLTAARQSARRGDALQLARLDALVTRLTRGMTAGEELALRGLVERRAALTVRDLLAWHERLPPLAPWPETPEVELIAAVVFSP